MLKAHMGARTIKQSSNKTRLYQVRHITKPQGWECHVFNHY